MRRSRLKTRGERGNESLYTSPSHRVTVTVTGHKSQEKEKRKRKGKGKIIMDNSLFVTPRTIKVSNSLISFIQYLRLVMDHLLLFFRVCVKL